MDAKAAVQQRFTVFDPVIDERTMRLLVAAESSAFGPGGINLLRHSFHGDWNYEIHPRGEKVIS